MATFTKPRQLFVIATVSWMTVYNCQPAVAQFMPRFGAAFKRLVGKGEEEKIVAEKEELPAPKVTEQNYARVQLAIGDSLAKEGNFRGAQSAYEAAIRNDPSLAGAYHHLARLQERLGSGDESKALFQRAHELDPNNAEIICDYGYWCYLRNDWKESGRHFQRALQLNPDLKRAHNNLGLLYARTGQPDEALKQFALAGLTEADARANLGFVYLSERRMPEAKTELRRAAESNSAKARDVLASLDRVEKSAQPRAAQIATTNVPVVDTPNGKEISRLPEPVAEPSPHSTVLRDQLAVAPSAVTPPQLPTPYVPATPVEAATPTDIVARPPAPTPYVTAGQVGAPGRAKAVVPTVEQAPYVVNSTPAVRDTPVAAPAVAAPSYVAVASKQVELPSTGQPTIIADSSMPKFSPVLSDYPHWDTPVAPASAVGFTQKVAQSRANPRVAPAVPAASATPAAPPSAPAPAPPKSKATVRFVPNASR
jgi:Tfp pilus assembly protein PilF